MKAGHIAVLGIFVTVSPALAAPQPIKVLPGQAIKACAKTPARPAVVCTRKIEVRGGAPVSGYTFAPSEGTTLPAGIKLTADGIVTATRKVKPPLPAAGSKLIRFSVSDGPRKMNATVPLQMDTSEDCSCPDLTAGFGNVPDAQGGQPYGLALPVSGPPSDETVAPNYTWTLNCTGIPAGLCSLPPGMTLNAKTGVLSGTPVPDTSGHHFVFKVKIKEKSTNSTAVSISPFILHVD